MTISSALWPGWISEGLDRILAGEAETFHLRGLRARQDKYTAAGEIARQLLDRGLQGEIQIVVDGVDLFHVSPRVAA